MAEVAAKLDTVGSLWDLVPPAMKDDLTTA
jgi:hypothetical protein